MYKVFAENIKIYKSRGVYELEKKVENIFSVNVILEFKEKPKENIDYEQLVAIVYKTSEQPFEWMEDFAQLIFDELSKHISVNCKATVNIRKKNPALLNYQADAVGIELSRIIH